VFSVVWIIEQAHNPKLAGSNPAPANRNRPLNNNILKGIHFDYGFQKERRF